MKIKNIGKWTVCALVALPLLACSSSERVEDKMMVDDGAVLISGDLTYEKAMEALAPLMTKNDVAVMKIIENGQIGQPVAVDAQLREIKVSSVVHLYFTQSDEVTARLEVPARLKDYRKIWPAPAAPRGRSWRSARGRSSRSRPLSRCGWTPTAYPRTGNNTCRNPADRASHGRSSAGSSDDESPDAAPFVFPLIFQHLLST